MELSELAKARAAAEADTADLPEKPGAKHHILKFASFSELPLLDADGEPNWAYLKIAPKITVGAVAGGQGE